MFGRRLLVLLLVLAAIGVPAGALRAACAGRSCTEATPLARVPFCPLPSWLRADLVAGYRAGRSPDVLIVTRRPSLWGGTNPGRRAPPWPTAARVARGDTAVPIVFWGTGVAASIAVPAGMGLDQIAPTVSQILSFRRPHPDVRAGTEVARVADGASPRLVLEVAWTGVGSRDLRRESRAWPSLRSLLSRGAGTMSGDTGSLPLDPAATLTTIGTGGLPSQHGITGTLIRSDAGRIVRAWGAGAPFSVIATLPDDLDQAMHQRPRIGLVAADPADQGIIGGNWYVGHDRDDEVVATGDRAVSAARRLLASGYGRDAMPDLLAVVLDGSVASMDRRTEAVIAAAERASRGSLTVVVAGTGTNIRSSDASRVAVSKVVSQIEAGIPGDANVIAGVVPGGLFLDQRTVADQGITGDTVVGASLAAPGASDGPLFEDAFQGFAVSFARYC